MGQSQRQEAPWCGPYILPGHRAATTLLMEPLAGPSGTGNCPFACVFVHSFCPETSHCDVTIACVQWLTLWVKPATLILADTSRLSPQSLNVPQQRLPNSLGCLRPEIPAAAPG